MPRKSESQCSVWWCDNKHYALGLCKAHWEAVRRYKTPYGKHERQMSKIDALILKARLVAVDVLEFERASTEFAQKQCPFCGRNYSDPDGHDALCAINLARDLLRSTSRCIPPEDSEYNLCVDEE